MPTGVSFANFCTSALLIPCQMCLGKIGIASAGSKACGLENVTTTSLPFAVMSFISLSHCANCEEAWAAIVENVNTTSSAENGFPSCHFTPERKWYVTSLPSAETSLDWARLGITFSWASRNASALPRPPARLSKNCVISCADNIPYCE